MTNDPGAWGGSQPEFLVLDFSKGSIQADIYAQGRFEDVAFGSLIRCSLTRLNEKSGRPECLGALVPKSFSEIPEIIERCAQRFLRDLPVSVRVVFLLGSSDAYINACHALLRELFPDDFRRINAVAAHADGRLWVHVAHPSGANGHFDPWLTEDASAGGAKRLLAEAALGTPGQSQPMSRKVSELRPAKRVYRRLA